MSSVTNASFRIKYDESNVRFEYQDPLHALSILPGVQQVIGLVTIFSSLARLVTHVAKNYFLGSTAERLNEIKKDDEGISLGICRMIPVLGSFISAIVLSRIDRNDGILFPALSSDETFQIVRIEQTGESKLF